MRCTKCGADNPEDAAVCQSCGEQLSQAEQVQPEAKPKNYLVWAVLATMFCAVVGVVSLIYALQVDMKWSYGDYAGARAASKEAGAWAWIAFILSFILYVPIAALVIFSYFSGVG